MIPIALAATGAIVGADLAREWRDRRPRRAAWYTAAQARARATRKPLLVVGDPDGGMTKGDYGYGDVCLDLTGCPRAPRSIRGSIDAPIPLPTGSHVVFVCYVLELAPDIRAAVRELRRVAGPDLFVLALHPSEWAAYKYPGTRWLVTAAPRGDTTPIHARRIDRRRVGVRLGPEETIV